MRFTFLKNAVAAGFASVLLTGCAGPRETTESPRSTRVEPSRPRAVPEAPVRDFSVAAAVLEAAIANRAFPGCSVIVGTGDGVVWQDAFGHQDYESGISVTTDTIYDLASLTKVIGTTGLLMRHASEGKLAKTDLVSKHLPDYIAAAPTPEDRALRERLTLHQLMTHTGGLVSWKPYYKTAKSYDDLLRMVMAEPLEVDPGTRYKYSDPTFILLGELAARIGGKPQAALERELVFGPLGMNDTLRNPAANLLPRIAPTEIDPATGKALHGVVHDENSRSGDGLTGHAGLFSTTSDLSAYATEMLAALEGRGRVFSQAAARDFTTRQGLEGSGRGLGWQLPAGRSSAGSLMSRNSFGHTGFTGTSIWVDPERKLYVILLTNRVHPSRKDSKIAPVRRDLADAVVRIMDGASAGE